MEKPQDDKIVNTSELPTEKAEEKKTTEEQKDERKVPPLRIKLSSIRGKHSKDMASLHKTIKKGLNVQDKADLLSKTFVVDNNRSSSPSVHTISLGEAEQSVKALDMQLKGLTAPGKVKHTARKQVPRASSQKFHCKKCTYTTNVRGNMQDHIYNHTTVVPYSCGHCGAIFGTRSGVIVHTKRDHRGRPYSILKADDINEEDYYTETRLDKGGPSGLPRDAPAPEKVLPAKASSSPSRTNDSKSPNLKCVHCAFATSDLPTIQSHVSLHKDKDRRYVCPLCDLAYCKYADGMVKHFQKWHPNQKVILQYQPDYYDTTKDISMNSTPTKSVESSPKSDSPAHDSDHASQNSLKGILDTPAPSKASVTPVAPKPTGKGTARKSMKSSPPANVILKVPSLNNIQQRSPSGKSKV